MSHLLPTSGVLFSRLPDLAALAHGPRGHDANGTAANAVQDSLQSCHAAIGSAYAFEAHLPVADLEHSLAKRSNGVGGAAVAGMPMGPPGTGICTRIRNDYPGSM